MPSASIASKRANLTKCQAAWDYLVAHPYLKTRQAAAHAKVTPWVFTKWISNYHPRELNGIRSKLGLPLCSHEGATTENHFRFQITSATHVWDRFVEAASREEALTVLKTQLRNSGINATSIEPL